MEFFILPLIRAFPQSLIIRAGRDSGIEQDGMPVI